ncbi:transcriptional regulator containing an amidase domain and an AraC-type DNA-binding HTH domain [Sphaerochaeta pleomorpha str. Grapes]|uniref:Transcriptional regulator containing an amidase domain and an AraC-type DNA-binding HTH domain n=1 Tax=Sphaerochaeta pleomorpha (strain ATCC BAA-1885 / DSM 22778 / Grapes) TaxID=158190 RepID=G8QUN2_SPHPG|nr:helix-turn-helix domain-containing protein [Sphaerochaeta pleomorpha]AEV30340.1 transcriptional regulator containing an amidase domain and an AraC-type DNA-binding HTH domain [Sphaerochaeta pleomorpha str. Grapes]
MSYRILREHTFFHGQSIHVKVIKREPEIPYSLHSHEFFELVIVISGTGINITENERLKVCCGSAFLIPPKVLHGYEEVDNLVLYNILIGKNILSASMVDLAEIAGFKSLVIDASHTSTIPCLSPLQLEKALVLVEKIKLENAGMVYGKGTAALVYAYLLQLLVMLSRSKEKPLYTEAYGNQRIATCIAFMEKNLNKSLSLTELSDQAHMSASTLNRYFRLYTGFSPVEFHIRRRIKYACSLIQTSNLTMEGISEATGFSDGNYFARQFRNIMELSPRQYKRIWTNQPST